MESGGYDMSKNASMFEFAGTPFGQIATGIATAKQNTALHRAIAQAFAILQRNGTYQKIMTKWGLKLDILQG